MQVQTTHLPNGLIVVTEAMPELESAALGVWVRAGSRSESESEHGLAHLLEHMAFKGTSRRSAQRIAEEIENVGGDINAATSVETTAYYARVLGEDVPLAFDVLHDILADSTFDADELEREQHVILQEIGAAADTPDDLVFDLFQDAAYRGQPIGRPILGTPDSVTGMTAGDLRGYLATHYRGASMVISAAGAVDHEAVVRQVEGTFGSFAASAGPPPPPARYTGGEQLATRATQEVQLVLGFEGRAYQMRDFYASQLLATILGGGMSSRLFQEVREKRGLCYAISTFHWGFSDTGVFGIQAATGEDDVAALMPVLLDELSRIADDLTQAEIDRARAQLRASLLMSRESPASRAGHIARQMLLFGRIITVEEFNERLAAISRERLVTLAAQIFGESPPTLAAVGPLRDVMGRDEIAHRLGLRLASAAE